MQAFEELEIEWGKFIGNPNCVACSSGTSALHLSLETLKKPCWTSHTRCIVPEFTMIACARAVVLADMQPVFVDCDDKLLMQVDNLPTWNVRALQAVHIYGRRCNMDAIHAHAKQNDCIVIEDMAEITGVKPHPDTDAACWSFYPNKIIGAYPNGEGGMIAFKNPEHTARAKQLRSLGATEKNDYWHIPRGHNYRLSNTHAELVLKSLDDYDVWTANQRWIVEQEYNKLIPKEFHQPEREAVWVYDIRIPNLSSGIQDFIVNTLNKQGVAARHGFKPMSSQPEFQYLDNKARNYPNAAKASQEVIYLPVSPLFSREDVEGIANKLLALLD